VICVGKRLVSASVEFDGGWGGSWRYLGHFDSYIVAVRGILVDG